jgi:SHS family lactate transporter-like MFS transporter
VLIIAFRLCLPETDAYIERQRVRAAGDNVGKTFINEGKVALKRHWLLLVYLVLLMAGMNFMYDFPDPSDYYTCANRR